MCVVPLLMWLLGCQVCQAFLSEFEKDFNFTCPNGSGLRTIESVHDSSHLDRMWHLDCCSREDLALDTCEWTDWVNDFDKEVNYMCGYDRIVAGVATEFSPGARDRKWQFRCCSLADNWIVHSCYFTDYLNQHKDIMSFTAQKGWFISGLHSLDDWHVSDRRFKVHVCKLDQLLTVVG